MPSPSNLHNSCASPGRKRTLLLRRLRFLEANRDPLVASVHLPFIKALEPGMFEDDSFKSDAVEYQVSASPSKSPVKLHTPSTTYRRPIPTATDHRVPRSSRTPEIVG